MNKSQLVGSLGHYGYSLDDKYNLKVDKANALVDKYNQEVIELPIHEQLAYQQETLRVIREILMSD